MIKVKFFITTKKKLLLILFLAFIFVLIINVNVYELFGYKISPFLLLGFLLVILSILMFINSNHKEPNLVILEFKFLSENFVNLIFLIVISILFFIPSPKFPRLIVQWENLSVFNYIRGISFILGCTYLPGSLIYRIFFKKGTLSKKFNIEPFIIKLTLYPLISFGFIGFSVLILDQINLNQEWIGLFLYLFILVLYVIEMILEKKKDNSIDLKIIKINVSKYTFIILLLAVGILTISIGFQIGWNYLISGDPWDAIKFSNHIGDTEGSPLYLNDYPNFWGYVSFGLGNLSGLPYINTNTFLAPFSYLFITSTYLLMKAVLYQFKTKYIVFSTILISIFSGIFTNPLVSSLIFVNEYYFIYKSYSYFLFFISMAIFLIILNNKANKEVIFKKMLKQEDFKLIILCACFIVISFMTYMFPLLFCIIFLFLWCLFSGKDNRSLNFRYFSYFLFFIFLIFLIFDFLLNFYLSYIIIQRFIRFFNYEIVKDFIKMIPTPILVYSLFSIFFLIFFIIKNIKKRKILRKKRNINLSKLFRFFLVIFSFFLITEIISIILESLILNFDLSVQFFFFLYLDKIFLNLGVIGTLGIYFSYYCSKKSYSLILTLTSWIIISFILAFLKISIEFIINFPLSPKNLSEISNLLMNYWFDRIWFYSIPALCIFTSIGFFGLLKKMRNVRLLNKIQVPQSFLKNTISIILILFSFSGIMITGFQYGNANFRYTNTQIETLDWISENIPIYSGVVVGDNFFMGVGTDSITFVRQYFFYDIFEVEFNETKCIEQIGFLKNNTIQYAVISQFFISYFLNKSDFVNNILVPDFYNITLYHNGDLIVHYAPYFD